MIVLLTCLSVLLVSVSSSRHALQQLLSQHDAFLFQQALCRDIHGAQSITANGSSLQIKQDNGLVYDYRFNPVSGLVYRSVDGKGTAVLAANVKQVQYTVMARVGVTVSVYSEREGFIVNYEWSTAFLEGKPKW